MNEAPANRPAARPRPWRPIGSLPIRHLRGLRVQILLWTILPLAVALIVLSVAGVFRHRQVMRHMVEDRDRGLVLAEANSLASAVQRHSALLASTAGALGANPQGELDRLAASPGGPGSNFADGLALLDGRGRVRAAVAADWADGPEARALAERAATTREVQYGEYPAPASAPGAPRSGLLMAAPAPDGGTLLGMLTIDRLSLTEAGLQLEAETAGGIFVLGQGGQMLYASDPTALGVDPAALIRAVQAAGAAPENQPDGNHGQSSPAGLTYLARPGRDGLLLAFAPIDPPGWTLVSAEDMGQVNSDTISVAEALPMVLLFVAVLALLAVSFGAAAIVRPLQELDRRAARVAWGDYEAITQPVGGIQEIDDLRCTLEQMSSRIRSYQAGMRDYLSATTEAQEEERARLAHELHDETVQGLIALKQRAQMARKALGSNPERAAARLDELAGLIDQELFSLRRLIGDLRPTYLEDLGFVPALEMLGRQVESRRGPSVDLKVQGDAVRLAPDLELAAYRIVQQALGNAVAHARAQRVELSVAFTAGELVLGVQDDGCGFVPPDQPSELARQGHYGLMGMRERALLYGGHMTLTSSPGQGTRVSVHLPALPRKAEGL